MARGIAHSLQSALKTLESGKLSDMEALFAARSPQQFTSLRVFLCVGQLFQGSAQRRNNIRIVWPQHGQKLSTLACCRPTNASLVHSSQQRTLATSPIGEQQMAYGGSSSGAANNAVLMAKALDVLRSRGHLQHLSEASAVHQELMRTLEVAQLLQSQQQDICSTPCAPQEAQAAPSGPVTYEGHVASLPQKALEAGVMLGATEEERRQSLFDIAFDETTEAAEQPAGGQSAR